MLNPEEAYKIAKQQHNFSKLLSCLDFGIFYLFSFAPLLENTNDGYLTGTTFDAVDKKTGKYFLYDITNDLSLYDKAKEIKINTVLDEVIDA